MRAGAGAGAGHACASVRPCARPYLRTCMRESGSKSRASHDRQRNCQIAAPRSTHILPTQRAV
eukprot:1439229-Alexandrium_andersonii.AAC.1